MSNIQDVSDFNTPSNYSAIKYIRNEIKTHLNTKETKVTVDNSFCKNEMTKHLYTFQKGSTDEKELYRVMPLDGNEKIYFDSKDEYTSWSKKRKNNV